MGQAAPDPPYPFEDRPHPMQARIWAAMTPAQRHALAVQLRRTAWDLKAAGLRMQHPDWPEARVQDEVRRIFLYAHS